jgi:hypothetical protein
MATLYWNGANSGDWHDILNWWADDGYTTQAAALPASGDSVVMMNANCTGATGSPPTVANLNCEVQLINVSLTVTGSATFPGGVLDGGTLTGDASFSNTAANYGTVTGNATFDNATNYNAVNGNATFVNGAYHSGAVNGNATLTDSVANSATVGGDYTATNGSTSGNGCAVSGNATLYGNHYGSLLVTGTATLYDSSWMDGYAAGGLTVNDAASMGCGWGGTATFNDSAVNNYSNWSYYYNDAVFNDNATNSSQTQSATFNDAAVNLVWVNAFGGATFNDDSVDSGNTYGGLYAGRSHALNNWAYASVVFSGLSRATNMNLESYFDADIEISGGIPVGFYSAIAGYTQSYTAITFTRAGLGVNGSSILGVV